MDLKLRDKVAVVTGGAVRVGREIALRLADEGARVAITYRSSGTEAEATRTELAQRSGQPAMAVHVDVTDEKETADAFARIRQELGEIDILVNNAGYLERLEPFVKTERTEWQRNFDVFTFGPMLCSQIVLPAMIERRYGKIVNLCGEAGRGGEAMRSITGAARAATMAFTKSLAKEVGRYQINVNAVSIGLVEGTDHTSHIKPDMMNKVLQRYPLRRLGRVEDPAPIVALLTSDLSSWMTGQVVSVSGGFTMM